ncbi:hypothetical protein [Clostridium intestinale]|uniref:Uncharacterized protein n=1 Tax=Clostridium intestinale URNW TaxID=1294142 RepID=U2NGH9_9CLOT|nr:hypothetical protein [Clostridium intestinale]ERK28213.1 hypothetical protein CINTURNW_4626 [Clostridium intestinale URNW]
MKVINAIINFLLGILDMILPKLGVPESFFNLIDGAVSTILGFLKAASWFIPLDILILCVTVMVIVDNFTLIVRVGQWIINLIRG